MRRYRPEPGLAGLGVFAGAVVISDDIGVRAPATYYPDTPANDIPYTTFKKPSFQAGVRGGYYPLAFLGGEIEGMVTAAQSDLEEEMTILGGRAQAVLQLPYWSLVPFVVGGVGYWNVLDDEAGDASDLAIHYGIGAKANVTRKVDLRIDVRDSIAGNGSPHHLELLAGAGLVFGRDEPVVIDTDHDGIVDDSDRCPLEPGLPANDGCPTRSGATSSDTDSDGVADPSDQCPTEAGVAPTGCPIRDADQDGVVDELDRCANQKGIAPTGCPDGDGDTFLDADDKCPSEAGVAPDGCPADVDGDGIVGAADHCPLQRETKNGIEDGDGCPDQLPPEVKNLMGVVAGIEFERKKADLSPVSEVVLENAAIILKQYPSLRVEIVGHTDARGERQMNIDLSLQRAMAVKENLALRGIDPDRLETRGAGPDEPITENETAEGRAKNRRIEFHLIEQPGQTGTP